MRPERSTTTCQQCSGPLTPYQLYHGYRRCSRACFYASQRHTWPPRDCERCGQALTRRQLKDRQRYCSRGCAFLTNGRPSYTGGIAYQPACRAVLEVLSGQNWPLTYADLGIWCFGDDGP
ncbi:MAG TPA: hypothetical protein VIV12_20385, partial [Streptosporangiaceae bacterium]